MKDNMNENIENEFTDEENNVSDSAENEAVENMDGGFDADAEESAEYAADGSDEYMSDGETGEGDGADNEYAEYDGALEDGEAAEDSEGYPYAFGEDAPEDIVNAETAKRKKKTAAVVAAGVVVVAAAITVYSVCVMNGVGTKSIVNTAIPSETNDVKISVKYESPVMSLFDSMVYGGGDKTVIKVNDENVSRSVFNYIVDSAAVNYGYSLKQSGDVKDFKKFDWNAAEKKTGMTNAEYVKGSAVESLVPVYALISEGEKHGIKLSGDEEKKIQDWLKQVKSQYGDQFATILKQSGYESEEVLVEMQKLQSLMSKVYADVEKDISKYATAEQLKPYMDEDKITAKHILIPFEENADDNSKAETKKKAEDILAKINAGEDFDKLREENSQDPGQPDAGYTFANDGTMVQEFTDAAFALKPGEVSKVVETQYGYHIIKRVERVAAVDEYMNMLRATAKVRIKKSAYDKIAVNVNLEQYLGAQE